VGGPSPFFIAHRKPQTYVGMNLQGQYHIRITTLRRRWAFLNPEYALISMHGQLVATSAHS